MGLLRWIRGDDNSSSTGMMSAGLAEIAAIFQPTRHKQTEHVEETTRRRLDPTNGTGVDLDRGVVVIRRAQPSPSTHEPDHPEADPNQPGPLDLDPIQLGHHSD